MRDLVESEDEARGERILFLQGPPSIFWRELADAFDLAGATVSKIHFAPADLLFWRGPADRFSGSLDDWRAYLRRYLHVKEITRIFLYADRLPHHQAAIELARAENIAVHVMENGYLRPDWLTLERNGMGRYSEMSRDPKTISAAAVQYEDVEQATLYPHPFFQEAWREVVFHLVNGLTPRRIWRFDHNRYYHPVVDYGSFALNSLGNLFKGRKTRGVCAKLLLKELPFYFAPLQLQSDYAVRDNSDYDHVGDMIDEVVASFAKHAPRATRLLFKTHPHDNGYENWARRVARAARRHNVSRRVCVIDGGPFGTLVNASKGVVVINSTSGLHALRALKPVIALGDAVYDVPGLTHQRGLDSFWSKPDAIDSKLVRDFVRLLGGTVQVKGSFFNPEGRRVACRAVVDRVIGVDIEQLAKAHGPQPADAISAPAWKLQSAEA